MQMGRGRLKSIQEEITEGDEKTESKGGSYRIKSVCFEQRVENQCRTASENTVFLNFIIIAFYI